MKKLITCVVLLLVSVASVFSQDREDAVTIKGVLKQEKLDFVTLYQVVEGGMEEVSRCLPDAAGQFGFHFYPNYEGFFVLGVGADNDLGGKTMFWFKSGDHLKLELAGDTYRVLEGSEENRLLSEWAQLSKEVRLKSLNFMRSRSTYKDFFPAYIAVEPEAKAWLKGVQTSNALFLKRLTQLVDLELAYIAVNYLYTPRSAHPKPEEIPALYDGLQLSRFLASTDYIYGYPWGRRVLGTFVMREGLTASEPRKPGLAGLQQSFDLIPNDTLKGEFALQYASRIKDYANYMEFKEVAGPYLTTTSLKARDFLVLQPLATFKPGDPGLEFKYEDASGKEVAFSDLRGKIVLVDVWATWCGPCRAEFPHLRKLKEEFAGTDLVVLGLSTDAAKDKEKWKQMIVDEQLGGVQLLAGPGNEVSKYYNITGIPRFMLFDREGKIVTIDAPRPSNPALKALLQKLL